MKSNDRLSRVSKIVSRLCSFIIGLALFVIAPFMPETWSTGWLAFALVAGAIFITAAFYWED